MFTFGVVQDLMSIEVILGFSAGALLAMIVHQARGVALAFGVVILTAVAVEWLNGGPERAIAWITHVASQFRVYGVIGRAAVIGGLAYTLYSVGYAFGRSSAQKK